MTQDDDDKIGDDKIGDDKSAHRRAFDGARLPSVQRLLGALRGTDIFFFYQNDELIYEWLENVPDGFSARDSVGNHDRDLLPAPASERLIAAKQHVLDTQTPQTISLGIPTDKGVRHFDVWIDPDIDEDGRTRGVICSGIDKTDERQREIATRNLLREVNHRSGNLLAIVQSLAKQTSQHVETVDEFYEAFIGRLNALSVSQAEVTEQEWRGASLHALLARLMARSTGIPVGRVTITGDDPTLTPNSATHVGLALHELFANSLLAGALSGGSGNIAIDVSRGQSDGARGLVLTWSEAYVDTGILTDISLSFGILTLERVVPAAIGGRGTLTIDGHQVTYTLFMPESSYDHEA
ncbi:MAG: HWE histidine kinase domain-containing protein [Pseudomonadota bacterium]